jgi:hypothetical protein
MTFAEKIKTRAFWLRFFCILFGLPLAMGLPAGVLYLAMSDTSGPWIMGAGLVACVGCLAYDIGKGT